MLRNLLICLSCFLHFALFAQVPSVVISPLNPSVCSGNTLTLTASTNAAPGATFLWMPGGATTPSIAVSPSMNTTYTCTVSSGAFSNSSSSTVTVSALPTATMVVNGITLTVNSTSPVTYMWSNGTVLSSIFAFQSGQYCCWITDLSGCGNSICVNYINPTLNYSIAGQDATINCNQNTNGYQLGTAPIAGHTYSWSPTSGLSNPNIANPIANPTVTTTYTLTDFDANGNAVVDQVTITVNTTPPTINAGPDQTVCQGSNLTLNATSNASPITWNNGIQNNIPFVANTTGSTTYTASVTGTNGCVASDNMVVLVNPQPQFNIIASGPTTLCSGQSVTLCVPYQYPWAYNWSNASISNCITVSYPDTYCVVVTDYLTGCSNMACIPVNIFNSTNAGPDATISCTQNTSGAQIGSAAVAGITYSWSPASGLSNPNSSNPIANPTSTTTYTLTATNAMGCTTTDQVVVNVNTTPPTLNAGPDQTVCMGSNVTLNATSNANPITWNNGVQNNIPFIANSVGTTTYTATATGANGCVASDQVVLTVNPTPVASVTATGPLVLCPGQSVTLCANTSLLVGYMWCTGETTQCITVNSPGNYCLVLQGFNGCMSSTINTIITAGNSVIANAGPDVSIGCSSTTSSAAIGSAPQPGSIYSWSPATGLSNPNSANPIAQPTANTTYTLTVTNSSGCTATDQVVITVNNTPPTINAGPDQTVCQGTNVTLNAISNAPTTTWSNGVQNNVSFVANNIGTTIYTATASGANGCVTSDQVVLTVNPIPVVTIMASGPLALCPGGSVTLSAISSPGCTFQWKKNGLPQSNGNMASFVVFQPGNYTVTVTNINGCISTSNSITISFLQAILSATGPTTICPGSSVVLQASTGTGYTYQWVKNGNTAMNFTNNSSYTVISSGIYSVNILTPGGCLLSSNNIQVQVLSNPSVNIIATGSTTICSGSSLTLIANSTSSGLTYQWKKNGINMTGANNTFYSVTQAGTYTVVVSNPSCPNNQVSSNPITVTVNPSPTPTITATTLLIAPGTSATLSTPLITGNTYQWQKFNGNFPISIPGANSNSYTTSIGGTYRVRATNTFGCAGYSPQLTLVNTQMPEIESPKMLANDSNDKINIYPNPNNGQFNVEITSELVDHDMHILDINGRIIQIAKLNGLINSINSEGLARGTYWLQIGSQQPIQMVKN